VHQLDSTCLRENIDLPENGVVGNLPSPVPWLRGNLPKNATLQAIPVAQCPRDPLRGLTESIQALMRISRFARSLWAQNALGCDGGQRYYSVATYTTEILPLHGLQS
jgi:hypothetical protein